MNPLRTFTTAATLALMLTCSVQYASAAGGSLDLQNISVDRFGGSWNRSLAASDAQRPGGAYYMIYRVYFQQAGEYVIDLESSAFDTYLQVAEVGTQNILAENDDDGGSTNSHLHFNAFGNDTYDLIITSFGSMQIGAFQLSIQSMTGPGTLDLQQVSVDRFGGSWSRSLASSDVQRANGAYYMIYRVTFQQGGEYIIDLGSADFDTYLQVAEVGTQNILAENDDDAGSTNSHLHFDAWGGDTYDLIVTSFAPQTIGAFQLSIQSATGPGTLDLQQVSVGRFGGNWFRSLASSDVQRSGGQYYMIYRVHFQTDGEYVIDLESNSFDTLVQVAEAGTQNIFAEDDDGGSGNNSHLHIHAHANETLDIIVTTYSPLQTGDFQLSIRRR